MVGRSAGQELWECKSGGPNGRGGGGNGTERRMSDGPHRILLRCMPLSEDIYVAISYRLGEKEKGFNGPFWVGSKCVTLDRSSVSLVKSVVIPSYTLVVCPAIDGSGMYCWRCT